MKKGVAMSFEVIVAAVLAIVVLIVLMLLFSGKINIFAKHTEDCSSMGGTCRPKADCNAEAPYKCSGDDVCCINYCMDEGGSCVQPCVTSDTCANKCPIGQERKYLGGCDSGLVCCKGE
jgi:hypothetical protein